MRRREVLRKLLIVFLVLVLVDIARAGSPGSTHSAGPALPAPTSSGGLAGTIVSSGGPTLGGGRTAATQEAPTGGALASAANSTGWTPDYLRGLPKSPVRDQEPGLVVPGSTLLSDHSAFSTAVLVTLAYSNLTSLETYLADLVDPASPAYHHYLSQAEFDNQFGGSPLVYQSAVRYFESFGVSNVSAHPDRSSLTFTANAEELAGAFSTSFGEFIDQGRQFYAPLGTPALPAPLAKNIVDVSGLSNYSLGSLHTDLQIVPPTRSAAGGPIAPRTPPETPTPCAALGGPFACTVVDGREFPQPVSISLPAQLLFLPDLQATYDVERLYDTQGYPTGQAVATILWDDQSVPTFPGETGYCATVPTGSWVADFYAPDVESYLGFTMPPGEPRPLAVSVAINGAGTYFDGPGGESAQCDEQGQYGATVENTLDLESLGSIDPGASIYQVYGQGASPTTVDAAFADILNPMGSDGPGFTPTVVSGLSRVHVVSGSFGSERGAPDASWNSSLVEAQARGISVLTASGDCGCDLLGPTSAASYDTYGGTSVGGTVLTLNTATLARENETAWPGSAGGVSKDFAEPSWQALSANANAVVRAAGSGRGVPDLSAIAAYVPITVTLGRFSYNVTNLPTNGSGALILNGTSISTPTVAGIVEMFDYALGHRGAPPVGFLNPLLYSLGQLYDCSQASLGLYDVTLGSNADFAAADGYDLVSGWGVLDAATFERWLGARILYHGGCQSVLWQPKLPAIWHPWLDVPCDPCSSPLTVPAGDTVSFPAYAYSLPSGTYEYIVVGPSKQRTSEEAVGNLSVNGTNLTLGVSFVPRGTAGLSFTEAGLPRGTLWCADVATQTCGTTSVLRMPNLAVGPHYPYVVEPVPGYGAVASVAKNPAPLFGWVGLKAGGTAIHVKFRATAFGLTVNESGLAKGTSWTVTLSEIVNGRIKLERHTTLLNESLFLVPNGTYTLTVTAPKGYLGGGSLSVLVSDGPLSVAFVFKPSS